MDRDLQNYYEELFDLFAHPGWKNLVSELENGKAIYSDITTVADERELFIRQGRMQEINFICNFPSTVEDAYASLQEDDDDIV